jgi:hypothetical protein
MIELGKQYKTRDGCEVRIYAVDGGGRFPVHGAVKLDDGTWRQEEWTLTGSYNGEKDGHTLPNALDLIEVKPRIQREVWVNVYRHDDGAEFFGCHKSRAFADLNDTARIACVKFVIDCEEGEGL